MKSERRNLSNLQGFIEGHFVISKEAFVRRWKFWLMGLATDGHFSSEKLGPMQKAEKHHSVGPDMERFLGQMYDSIVTEEKGAK